MGSRADGRINGYKVCDVAVVVIRTLLVDVNFSRSLPKVFLLIGALETSATWKLIQDTFEASMREMISYCIYPHKEVNSTCKYCS